MNDRSLPGGYNIILGSEAATNMCLDMTYSVIVGRAVPGVDDGVPVIRIGAGNTYLEIREGKATIVGAVPSEAVKAVLDGIGSALAIAADHHEPGAGVVIFTTAEEPRN